jgi:inner membrane protein
MPGIPLEPWILLGLLASSVVVTLATNWLVAKIRHWTVPPGRLLSAVVGHVIWILLLFAAGLLATRYVERIPTNGAMGYAVFGLAVFVLSWVRALLYQRAQEREQGKAAFDKRGLRQWALHTATYLLGASTACLALSWLLKQPVEPLLLIPLSIGALLPDLDCRTSALGRLLPWISRQLEGRLGHGQQWHTLAANAGVALSTALLIPLIGWWPWTLISLGFLSHLILDILHPQGIMLLWPFKRTRYFVPGLVTSTGSPVEGKLAIALAVATAILLFAVDFGPAPAPAAAPLSYEQTLERYYSLRGRNLVFADVEGTWQATGRRVADRFEVLNAAGPTLVMLDRYTGRVFTAGHAATDHLYLNRITLLAGDPARIKPVEVQLRAQRMADALPVLYQMQLEPGLQHIFVSGDVILPTLQEVISPTLRVDYSQTQVRRIEAGGPGHYTLHYLAASDLIALANLQVESADLVVVATYAGPTTGPTVTPLPSPPATPQESP